MTVALVSPRETSEVTSTRSRSKPLMVLMPPVVCGRSPAVVIAPAVFEWLALKKFAAGLTGVDSDVPFHASASPLPRFEPAYPMPATLASKLEFGTWKPVTVTDVVGLCDSMMSRPSKIVRLRGGSPASR
jgi:hypothetical protein